MAGLDREHFLENALARAEARYEALADAMSEGMIVMGPSGAIIDSNAAACEILGLSQDELFGRVSKDPRWNVLRPGGENFPVDERPATMTLRTGEAHREVVMGVVTPAGERKWLSVNSRPVRQTPDGRVDQVIVVFRVIAPIESVARDKAIREQLRRQ